MSSYEEEQAKSIKLGEVIMGSTYITENRRPFEPKSSRTTTVFRQTHRKKCVHQQNGRMTGLNRIHGGCN